MTGWYDIPKDPKEIADLRRRVVKFINDPDTQNLYAMYLIRAIDEIVYLREQLATSIRAGLITGGIG